VILAWIRLALALAHPELDARVGDNLALEACSVAAYAVLAPSTPDGDVDERVEQVKDLACSVNLLALSAAPGLVQGLAGGVWRPSNTLSPDRHTTHRVGPRSAR
jgi:hypothetical protein